MSATLERKCIRCNGCNYIHYLSHCLSQSVCSRGRNMSHLLSIMLLLIPAALGLTVISKADFEKAVSSADFDQNESSSKAVEFVAHEPKSKDQNRTEKYVPIILRRKDNGIEARIPLVVAKNAIKFSNGKTAINDRRVPVVRGARVVQEFDDLEGLYPPSQTAPDVWRQSQHLESNYPNSNGYYPNVGGDGYTNRPPTPKPMYGVPNQGGHSGWGCSASLPWGQQMPPQQPGSGPGGYPPSNYPPQNSGYPPGMHYPPNQSGNRPPNNWDGQSQWQQSNWASRPWNERQAGRWVSCDPVDLTNTDGRRRSSDCPTAYRLPARPVSKVDDRTLFNQLPKDVEEVTP